MKQPLPIPGAAKVTCISPASSLLSRFSFLTVTTLLYLCSIGSGMAQHNTWNYRNLTEAGGSLYFTTYDRTYGTELWKSNGLAEGDYLVRDIVSGVGSSNPQNLTNVNGTLFFVTSPDNGPLALWKTNGTAAGTIKVLDLPLQQPTLTALGATLLISGANAGGTSELWRSNGTAAGTMFLKNTGEYTSPFTASGNNLFFVAGTAATGAELWKTDGTATGTTLVRDINPGAATSAPTHLTDLNGTLYFSATTGTHGRELWKSNGTAAGTVLVKDLLSGSGSSDAKPLANFKGSLYFAAQLTNAETFREGLYKTDGTAAGTVLVESFGSLGTTASRFGSAVVSGNLLYFDLGLQTTTQGTSTFDIALWRTDGTAAGTSRLQAFGTESYPTGTRELTDVDGTLFFAAASLRFHDEVWKSDGTPAGTQKIKNFALNPSSIVEQFTVLQGTLYFLYNDEEHELPELWRTDGNSGCTVPVQEFFPTSGCGARGSLVREVWTNAKGAAVSNIPLTTAPSFTTLLSNLEGPRNEGDSYGARIRAYLHPPLTGDYTFLLAGDNNCELWLSTTDLPANRQKIASFTGNTTFRQWDKYPSQTSAPVRLQAGRKYYLEVLHKEDNGGDHVSVAWQLPGGALEAPIPGARLSTYLPATNTAPTVRLTSPKTNDAFSEGAAITLSAEAVDLYGRIKAVAFYAGQTKIGETSVDPHAVEWRNAQPGTHQLTARATDHEGATTTSAPVSVTVTSQNRQFDFTDLSYGGPGEEDLKGILATPDGGLLYYGSSSSAAGGDKSGGSWGGQDYWIIKTSAAGARQWDRTFGGSADDLLQAALQTPDGGYLLAGTSASGISGDKTGASRGNTDYWVVKISATGTLQWDRVYGGTSVEELGALVATADGSYLLAGSSYSEAGADKTHANKGNSDYWIVKIGADGTKIWDRTLGGDSWDDLRAALATTDGGFLLGGPSYSGAGADKTGSNRGLNDYWVVKVSATGTKLWDRTYGGSFSDALSSLVQTADGGYLLGGSSTSDQGLDKSGANRGEDDFWVIKTDPQGLLTWDRTFGGSESDYLASMALTADGHFLLGGYSRSGAEGDKSEANRGDFDFWALLMDAQGNRVWDRTFGGSRYEELRTVLAPAGGGYLLGGTSLSGPDQDKTSPSRGSYDYWVVRLQVTENGETNSPACTASGTILREFWNNVPNKGVAYIPLNTTPSGTGQLTSFETAESLGDHYGARIRGYICPPQTGDYTFWIAGDDHCELWLSTDDQLGNRQRVAYFNGYTALRQYTKYATQQSQPIRLEAGKRYYIEALHKEDTGGDHVSVAWQLPNGVTEAPIAGSRLSPFEGSTAQRSNATVTDAGSTGLTAFPNPFTDRTTLQFRLAEAGEASLEVYDLQGRLVQRVFAGISQPGITQTFDFDGKGLARGIYVARLVAGQKVISQKLVLDQ